MAPRVAVTRLERWLAARGGHLERLRYPRANGGEAEAWRLVPAAARARVVALHGAGNDALYPQVALFQSLCAAGCEVFACDLDGHGAQSTTRFSVDGIRSVLPAAVAQAERGRDALPLHLLGHSLGGALVLDALASGSVPHATSAAVLAAPLRLVLDGGTVWRELSGFLRPATLRQRRHYGLWGMIPAAGPLKRRAYPIRGATQAGAPFAYTREVQRLLEALRLEERAASIPHPVLLVYGTADRIAPPDHGRVLQALLRRPRLVEVPGGSHWSTALDPFASTALTEWLEPSPPRSSWREPSAISASSASSASPSVEADLK